MGGIGAIFAIFLLVAFLGGVLIGVVVIASLASRKEDRLYSLTGDAPDPVCEGTRRLTGACTRGSGFISPDMRPDGDARTGPNDGGDASGQEPVR
jgi:hypothetical protein